MKDLRVYLKIKIKSLSQEARIIRDEERKPFYDRDDCGYSPSQEGLHNHRVTVVRRETRHTLLAYAFIRGVPYKRVEAKCHEAPDWKAVKRMVAKYGPSGDHSLAVDQWAGVKSARTDLHSRLGSALRKLTGS